MNIIKSQHGEAGKYVSPHSAAEEPEDSKHPAFCFRHLVTSSFPEIQKHRAAIANTLKKLGLLSWSEIKSSNHQQCGYEHGDFIGKKTPTEMSRDTHLLIFRCSEGRMIGYRNNKIFYVFWFDWPPYKIYAH